MINFIREKQFPLADSRKVNWTWFKDHAANSSMVKFNGTYFMYFRGIANEGPSSLGVWTSQVQNANGYSFNRTPVTNPILTAGASGTFDAGGIYDPVAVVFNNKVHIYYMGTGLGDSRIGLATSTDGLTFTKQGTVLASGITPPGGTPAVVVDNSNVMHIYYTKGSAASGWAYYHRSSTDGINFGAETLSFSASGVAGSFDEKSIITARVFYEAPYYYFVYGGSPVYDDYPEGFGIARSTDLINWERYPGNPILLRGACGTWEEAAVWSGDVININGEHFMYYEGVGTAATAGGTTSNNARDVKYGGYDTTAFSQIFAAKMSKSSSLSNWSVPNLIGSFKIKNALNGKYLGVDSSGNIIQTTLDSSKTFSISKNLNGFYSITNPETSLKLQPVSSSRARGAAVNGVASSGLPAQDWYFSGVDNNFYQITNRYSGMLLTADNGFSSNSTFAVLQPPATVPHQIWELIPQ